jgi:hypothetical protein
MTTSSLVQITDLRRGLCPRVVQEAVSMRACAWGRNLPYLKLRRLTCRFIPPEETGRRRLRKARIKHSSRLISGPLALPETGLGMGMALGGCRAMTCQKESAIVDSTGCSISRCNAPITALRSAWRGFRGCLGALEVLDVEPVRPASVFALFVAALGDQARPASKRRRHRP